MEVLVHPVAQPVLQERMVQEVVLVAIMLGAEVPGGCPMGRLPVETTPNMTEPVDWPLATEVPAEANQLLSLKTKVDLVEEEVAEAPTVREPAEVAFREDRVVITCLEAVGVVHTIPAPTRTTPQALTQVTDR
jgi:hypothetical protein